MISKFKSYIGKFVDMNNPIVSKLFSGMAWNITGTILSKALLMVSSIIIARILGADKNGEYSIINSTVIMFSTFAGLGLGTTATRFVAEYKDKDKEKCGRIIGLTNSFGIISGLIMAIILYILSPFLATEQLNAPHLSFGLRLASIMLLTNTVNTIQISILSGFERFRSIARLSIIQGIVSVPILIGFTYFLGVNGLLLGNIAISIFMLIIYAIENDRIKKSYKIGMDIIGARKEFGIIWRFSIPSLLSNVMVGPVMWLGNTFITAIPNGYTQLGVFNASNQWRTVLTFIPTAVGNVILPMIVNNKNNHRLERFNILFGWIIVICIAIPLIAAPELVGMLYGTGYKGDSFNISFILVILTCCILSYREGIARKLISNNLMWWGFLDNTIWGIIFLSVLYLVRNLGAVGISAAYSVAYIFNTLIFIPFYIKRGVVHRSLIISKEIILMWTSLLFQIATTAFIEYYLIRLLAAAFSLFSLYNLLKVMMAKQDLI